MAHETTGTASNARPTYEELRARVAQLEQQLAACSQQSQVPFLLGEERSRRVLDNMLEGCAVLSPDWTFLYVNEVNARHAHLTPPQMLGRSMLALIPGVEQSTFFAAFRRCMEERTPQRVEAEFTFADGASAWYEAKVEPVPEGIFVLSQDITERKRAEQELRAAHGRTTAILESIADAFYSLDAEWRFVQVNPAAERAPFGRPARELLGQVIWEVYPGLVGTRIQQHYLDAVAQRSHEHYEARSPLNGRWYEVFMFPRTGGLDVYLRDVDDRKKAEEAVRESERLYRAIGESINYGVWVCAPDGRNVYASESFLKLVGLTQQQCSDFGWGEVLHPDDAERTIATWKECVQTGGDWSIEHRFRGVDGRWHPILARGVPVKDAQGKVLCWAGINLDISQQKQAEDALREADRRKDEFLAVLSHELRNPLAPIRNSVFLLQNAPPGGEQAARARDVIDRQSAHLARLVDDLLDLSRISRGKIVLQRERVDLVELARRTVEDHRANFMDRSVGLHVEVPPAPLWLDADPTRIAQVIGNLVGNACKFTHRGGSVHVTVAVEESQAVLRVRDTGVGIAPDLLGKIFDPFTQAEQTVARSQGGLGLGLALVKGFVEMHGGTVSANSAGPESGAEFVVRLPLLERVMSTESRPATTQGARVLRVLVIEDNHDAAESLREVVEFMGHLAEVAFDGTAGLAAARELRPDVVLCDIGLPDMDGHAVARELRARADLAGCCLVALTGYALPHDIEKSRQAGFDHHLAKPPSLEELQRLLAGASGGEGGS